MYRELLDAVAADDVERVRALLDAGQSADPPEDGGPTALYRAAARGRVEIVRELLAHGAAPDRISVAAPGPAPGEEGAGAGGDDDGLPLCGAAACGDVETVAALLAAGADPRAAERDGWTPLLWAAANGHTAAARTLLEAGADVEAHNDHGDTPLTLAARRGATGVVRALLEHGADPDAPDGDGDTALSIAEDWLGVHLETALLEHAELEAPEGTEFTVTRAPSPDGHDVVTVASRDGEVVLCAQRGHAAVVTLLEQTLEIFVPFPDMLRRALAYRDADRDHETWWTVVDALAARDDEETFEAALELCTGDDPRGREFGADLLGALASREDSADSAGLGDQGADETRAARAVPVLRRMAVTEGVEAVLDSVLNALGRYGDPRALPEVLAVIRRPGRTPTPADPMALAAVMPGVGEDGYDDALAELLRMTEDDDPEVREWATQAVAGLQADGEPIRAALAARLEDSNLTAVAEAARGLAERDDARARDGVQRVLAESGDEYARDLAVQAARRLGLPETELHP